MFIGILVERAREVQQQWAAIETPPPTPGGTKHIPADSTDFKADNPVDDVLMGTGSDDALDPDMLFGGSPMWAVKEPQKDLGPLTPDHLREALRRYRRDGEGGGTGLTGFSVGLGVPGTASARLQGRRLFR